MNISPKKTTIVPRDIDVLVVGGGNAAMCAAITARELGANVLVLESSPKEVRGGNSQHTRNLRHIHKAADNIFSGPYLEEECYKDLHGVAKGNCDEEMARFVIREGEDASAWMYERGVRFQPAMRGTLHLSRTNAFFRGGGKALINAYYATAEKMGIHVLYDAEAIGLDVSNGYFTSARVKRMGYEFSVGARSVVLASGGYQGNLEWLRESWGPVAENVLIRGTPYDRGAMLKAMMEHGAKTVGDPTQGHFVAIDGRAPKFDGGIVTRLDCIPYGIAVNMKGERFYDEGEEIWPKRYAIWGRMVAQLEQSRACVVIDAKSIDLFMPSVFPPKEADNIRDLAVQLGLEPAALEKTVAEFNAAVKPGNFNPDGKDGCATEGLAINKTNWARRLDTPPYYGYPLAPGITFTYLSLAINKRTQVLMKDDTPCKNIFAAGELTSGNVMGQGYMGGLGMTIGTVFGRIAGREAAQCR